MSLDDLTAPLVRMQCNMGQKIKFVKYYKFIKELLSLDQVNLCDE